MDELRILVVGDVHLSDQSPGKRGETYSEDILDKMSECVEVANREDATHLLFLGDLFDKKEARSVSHKLVQRAGKILMGSQAPVYILVGNHDLASGGTLGSLNRQPLGILGMLPNVTLLTDEPSLVLGGDIGIFPVPGVPLEEDWRDLFNTQQRHPGKLTRRIMVVHQLIVPDVTQYPEKARRSFYDAPDIADATDADIVLYGDVHTNHGVYRKGDVLFSNLGSICRLSVGDVDHTPEIGLFVISGDPERKVSMKRIPLESVKDADEVFILDNYVQDKEARRDIENAVQKIKSTRVHKFSIDSVLKSVQENETVEPPVRTRAGELIEAVR